MKRILFSIIFLFAHTVYAIKSDTKFINDFKVRNLKVAELLRFDNIKNYRSVLSKLKSPIDKQIFTKIYSSKKAKKIKIISMMDRLIVRENGVTQVIQLMSVNPLRLKLNNNPEVAIDLSAIHKSFEKKNTASMINLLFPTANAEGLGWLNPFAETSESWMFLYAASANSTFWAGETPIPSDQTSELVAKEIYKFVSEYGITKINCTPSGRYTNSGTRSYAQLENKNGEKILLECDYSAVSARCQSHLLDSKGEVSNVWSDMYKADSALIIKLKDQIHQSVGGIRINPNDFDLECSESRCGLKPVEGTPSKTYSEKTLTTLRDTDFRDLGGRALRADFEAYAELVKKNKQHSYPADPNQTLALLSLRACCDDKDCAKQVKENTSVDIEGPAVQK